jgi:hypothetical protein
MSKLESEDEHPLDRIIFDVVHSMCPVLKRTHHTPNVITTYSFACGLLALRALWVTPDAPPDGGSPDHTRWGCSSSCLR